MTEQSKKSSSCIEIEAYISELKDNLKIIKRRRTAAKSALTKASKAVNYPRNALKVLQDNIASCECAVENIEADIVQCTEQAEIANYISDKGRVSIYNVGKLALVTIMESVTEIEVPVVEVLPMRGDFESDNIGTVAGSSAGASPFLNMEKYAPLIEGLFNKDMLDTGYVTDVTNQYLKKCIAEDDLQQLSDAIELGRRAPIKVVGKKVAGITLIDSDGGSPTEGYNLGCKIHREARLNDVVSYCFSDNGAASSGYLLLCSGDYAYASTPLTQIGSVGVRGGYKKLTERGIDKALIKTIHVTSGKNKVSTLDDPFVEASEDDVAKMQAGIHYAHDVFNDYVSEMRGKRLGKDVDVIFSGENFEAHEALEHGLIDGIGHYESVMKKLFGDAVVVYEMAITDTALVPSSSFVGTEPENIDGIGDIAARRVNQRTLSARSRCFYRNNLTDRLFKKI